MPDDLDRTQEFILATNENQIAAHRKKLEKETHAEFDGSTCVACGELMPQERLDNGRVRCTTCQGIKERKEKLFGGRK